MKEIYQAVVFAREGSFYAMLDPSRDKLREFPK
jgi:hypothetical protein